MNDRQLARNSQCLFSGLIVVDGWMAPGFVGICLSAYLSIYPRSYLSIYYNTDDCTRWVQWGASNHHHSHSSSLAQCCWVGWQPKIQSLRGSGYWTREWVSEGVSRVELNRSRKQRLEIDSTQESTLAASMLYILKFCPKSTSSSSAVAWWGRRQLYYMATTRDWMALK